MKYAIFLGLMLLPVWTMADDKSCGDVSVDQLKKEAAAGAPAAQKDLADLLIEGRCVPRNVNEAMDLYHRSAEQNHHSSQYALGMLLSEGKSVPKNAVEGYMWVKLSAPPSDKHTRELLEKLAKTMSRDEVRQANHDALDWMRSHWENAQPAPK